MKLIPEVRSIRQLGYEGRFTTVYSRMIDEGLRHTQELWSGKIIACVDALAYNGIVTETKEILAESEYCLCAATITLKQGGELMMLVPWPLQYREGARLVLFQRGEVGEDEIEEVLAHLAGIIEFGEGKNEQTYLM